MFLDDMLYKLTYLLTYNILTFAPLELNPKFGGEAGEVNRANRANIGLNV